jgi:hypothetical protein
VLTLQTEILHAGALGSGDSNGATPLGGSWNKLGLFSVRLVPDELAGSFAARASKVHQHVCGMLRIFCYSWPINFFLQYQPALVDCVRIERLVFSPP